MLDIKVCGMLEAENIKDVLSLQPNFMGFIFYEKSPRNNSEAPDGIAFGKTEKVGVFVKANLDDIKSKIAGFGLDYIQLHGDESPEYCESVRALPVKVIKVFRVDSNFDWDEVRRFEGKADLFLFDTKGDKYGGLGKKFDWELLNNYRLNVPFLLSGGIKPEDIQSILDLNHPHLKGIDVNSGFEIEPGLKDLKKLRSCFKEIRR